MTLKERLIAAGLSGALVLGGVGIAEHEGYLTTPYLDPKSIMTVCYGHTGGIVRNKKYSKEECDKLLINDLKEADNILKLYVKPEIYNKLKLYEKAAFLSFIFNVGSGKTGAKDGFVFLKNGNYSTMYKKLNAGDIHGACNELPKWNKDKLRGITIRRQKERDLCLNVFKLY